MQVDPELAPFAGLPTLDPGNLAAARAGMDHLVQTRLAALPEGWADDVDIQIRSAPGPADGPDVAVHVVTPRSTEIAGLLVYFHGGAFALGDAAGSVPLCAAYARRAGVVACSVEYRLAPEHPFPAGVEDAYAATVWAAATAAELGADPARVGVGGASAGGALAAAVCLLARERGGPALRFQLLDYPVLDDRQTTWSVRHFTDTPNWTSGSTAAMWDLYLRTWSGEVPASAAPARAADLAGLPPAYVLTCELDPLRDEGLDYARRLGEAGVPVELHQFPGTFHGYNGFPASVSRRTQRLAVDAIATALGPARPRGSG